MMSTHNETLFKMADEAAKMQFLVEAMEIDRPELIKELHDFSIYVAKIKLDQGACNGNST